MSRIRILNYIAAILLAAPILTPLGAAMAIDDAAPKPLGPRAEGRRLLAALPPIKQDAMHESCFELSVHGETIGYVVSTLSPLEHNGEPHYAYDDLCVIQGPSGAATELRTTGILDRYCSPKTITWATTNRLPIGAKSTSTETLELSAKGATFSAFDGKETKTVSVPLPAGRIVHCISRLLTMLQPQEGRDFMLREFNTESKVFEWRRYHVTRKEDGRLRVAVGDPKGISETAYYLLDQSGEVAQHGAAGIPFLFKRCSKDRVEAIKKELAEKPKDTGNSKEKAPATQPGK